MNPEFTVTSQPTPISCTMPPINLRWSSCSDLVMCFFQPGNNEICLSQEPVHQPRAGELSLIYRKAAGSDIAELICSGTPLWCVEVWITERRVKGNWGALLACWTVRERSQVLAAITYAVMYVDLFIYKLCVVMVGVDPSGRRSIQILYFKKSTNTTM